MLKSRLLKPRRGLRRSSSKQLKTKKIGRKSWRRLKLRLRSSLSEKGRSLLSSWTRRDKPPMTGLMPLRRDTKVQWKLRREGKKK